MMTGKRPIVVRLENSYQFHEHGSIDAAKAEAHRLARTSSVGGTLVVYAPVAIITRTPETTETPVTPSDFAASDDNEFGF